MELLGVIVGACISIITLIIKLSFDHIKLKSEEKRWYGEDFLKLQIKAFENLLSTLEDCYVTCNQYGNYPPKSTTEFNTKVLPTQEAYRRAIIMASIYLKEEEKKIFDKYLGAVTDTIRKIQSRNTAQINWSQLLDTREQAINCLKNLLNPKKLKEYIDSI